ncbi:MAG: acetyl-CoA carboxylase biotin carboxylase subunit [Candidatus Zixiibacteriota bacterium]|nr:MAG: acetyl-CoA carboxylase biotin carboxylase subunit [candidate division Zixibacteria bacterium]
MKKIRKILIANRGEIAVRVVRACRDLGITAVAVFSDADKTAYHVRMSDEAYHIGPAPSSESYLVFDKIIGVAKRCGADAVHPGYGFLAENGAFAKRCEEEGIIFIGPKSGTIALLGDKLQARAAALEAGLPVVPGGEFAAGDLKDALDKAEAIGYPVLIKAAAGGGGKGMRIVESPEQFEESLGRASSEALSAFGDGRVYIEKFLERPRHVEMQILCDHHGNGIYLGERECSIQRRHQKLIEESPSPMVTPELREKMGRAAVDIARQTGYAGAGTVEFMADDRDNSFYFLEVNTRLQVEHPVTELVTGVDLVKEQVAIAEGQKLRLKQSDISITGHAIECRICAEDPEQNFMPSTGTLKNYRSPAGPGVRVDSGVVIFSEVPIYYDPLIAKLIVWGKDRAEAIQRTRRALEEYRVSGLKTTIGFHRTVMDNDSFIKGRLSTRFLQEEYPDGRFASADDTIRLQAALAVALDKFARERKILIGRTAAVPALSSWVSFYRRDGLKNFGGSR